MSLDLNLDYHTTAGLRNELAHLQSQRRSLEEREAAVQTALLRREGQKQRLAPVRALLHDALRENYKLGQRNQGTTYTPDLTRLMDAVADAAELRLSEDDELSILLLQDWLQK